MGRVFVPESSVGSTVEYFVTPNQAGEAEPFRLVYASAVLDAVTTSSLAGDRVVVLDVEDKSQRLVYSTFCPDVHPAGTMVAYTFADLDPGLGALVSADATLGIVGLSSLWVYEGDRIRIRVENSESGDKLSEITLSFLPF